MYAFLFLRDISADIMESHVKWIILYTCICVIYNNKCTINFVYYTWSNLRAFHSACLVQNCAHSFSNFLFLDKNACSRNGSYAVFVFFWFVCIICICLHLCISILHRVLQHVGTKRLNDIHIKQYLFLGTSKKASCRLLAIDTEQIFISNHQM